MSNPRPDNRIEKPRTSGSGKGSGAPGNGSDRNGADKEPEKPSGPQRAVVRYSLALTILLAGAVLTSMLSLPMVMVSGLLSIGALVCAVLCLIAGIRAGQVPQAIVTSIIGLVVAGYILVSAIATAFIWDIRADFEACSADAITEQAIAVCQGEYNSKIADRFEELTGQPLPGSQAD